MRIQHDWDSMWTYIQTEFANAVEKGNGFAEVRIKSIRYQKDKITVTIEVVTSQRLNLGMSDVYSRTQQLPPIADYVFQLEEVCV
ncbi:MAG: hypothetical protein HN590_07680 [Calditrichaeota bacterium]|jgi:hypothetical protein|nr:hypothetical protein [Calditrichota bacterium]MBT7790374.1 hypothetical protein [Calditrichota bacterium]